MVRNAACEGPAEYQSPIFTDAHVLTVRLSAFAADRWHDGQPVKDATPCVGSSSFTSAGVQARRVVYGPWRSLRLSIPCAFIDLIAEEAELRPLDGERVGRALVYDRFVHRLAQNLVAEIEVHKPGGRLQLDALATELSIHLLRGTADRATQDAKPGGGLAEWQVRRAKDYIAAKLSEHITLADLARQVRLTQFHFSRAFKQSTGRSPHRFLLESRVARAKELLAGTDESIGAIAAQLGYDDPTQLSRLFRAYLGVTPIAYRRGRRS